MSDKQAQPEAQADQQAEPSFEERLQRLEKIVDELEQGSLPLDRALTLYEEGVRAYRACQGLLRDAEGKVAKLIEGLEGELRPVPMEVQEDE